ncbi:LUD domain-containing protein [Zooshikella marina]|uniref:LutC/YkgG family protein n=1 Tax=Zooshikella ganghwensis TaxID=202772 RepID=UPI001BAE96D6|nr:LUD domain-containing protein [Zooshikella ganghwensis]MBU2706658.1 LUD domain-containing protein [Zooshikella ganghwensis]
MSLENKVMDARTKILNRLHQAKIKQPLYSITDNKDKNNKTIDKSNSSVITNPGHKVKLLIEQLEKAHAHVVLGEAYDCQQQLLTFLNQQKVNCLLTGDPIPENINHILTTTSPSTAQFPRTMKPYAQPIEQWKNHLFYEGNAAITNCLAAIADTGTLVLQPSPIEPRTLSLVPPIHIVVLYTQQIVQSFDALLNHTCWPSEMPSNIVFISGPSKTADIQQTLAYGAHGPKVLAVFIIDDTKNE